MHLDFADTMSKSLGSYYPVQLHLAIYITNAHNICAIHILVALVRAQYNSRLINQTELMPVWLHKTSGGKFMETV